MKQPKFEDALGKLERIVQELETGELSLDDALKRFEEGVRLSRICSKRLEDAEKRIEIVRKREDGSVELEPFEASGEDERGGPGPGAAAGRARKKAAEKKEKPREEVDEGSLFS